MLHFFWQKLMAIRNGSVMIFWNVFARSLSWKSNLDCVRLNILDAEFSDVSIIRPGHDAGDHKDWNPSEKSWSKDNEQKHTSTATRAHRIILCMKRCPYRPSLKKDKVENLLKEGCCSIKVGQICDTCNRFSWDLPVPDLDTEHNLTKIPPLDACRQYSNSKGFLLDWWDSTY